MSKTKTDRGPDAPLNELEAPPRSDIQTTLDEIRARLSSAQNVMVVRAAASSSHTTATQPESDVLTPTIPLARALSLTSQQGREITAAAARSDVISAQDDPELRLPAAWYTKPQEAAGRARGLSAERYTLLIRGAAVACLTTAAALLIWLSTMSSAPFSSSPQAPPASLMSSFAAQPASFSTAGRPSRDPPSQDQISTARILAVAERFVATGDVLAARAMLQDRAGLGEPRALFALAETYDPHMLASWATRDAEASITYARFLYEAARRGGVAEAQPRLDALK
jgi:hypothetical protein